MTGLELAASIAVRDRIQKSATLLAAALIASNQDHDRWTEPLATWHCFGRDSIIITLAAEAAGGTGRAAGR